jgi:glycosyltransferase involved in cell wall biosynthesis
MTLHVAVDANVLEAPWGGIPKHVYRVVSELAAGGDRVDLLVNLRSWESPVPGGRSTPLRLRGRGLWRDLALPLWAARHKPDVLWAPETLLPRRVGVPTVVTVHDLAPLLFPGTKPPAVERAFRTSVPRSVRSATRVICVSETTARDVARHWGVQQATVIGNGVDDAFAPGDAEAERRWAAQELGIEGPFVLHVGSLEPRKGLGVLIEAAAAQPGWRLVLAGRPGHEGERIAADAREAGAVLLPDVDDAGLVRLYRAAEAVAVPSLYEGFGMVPLEAMASGTPAVVAADAGALAEVAGDAALTVADRTPEAWTRAIAEARERRESLVRVGLQRAGLHRWPQVAAAVRVVLSEAAGAA